MKFSVLGSLEVFDGETAVTPTSPKLRHVLAALILHANRPVRPESLIEEIWLQAPPASAATTLQTYIYRLRKIFAARQRAGSPEILVTINSSYLVRAQADQLDLAMFEQFSRQGQAALRSGKPEEASSFLGEALSLWRGHMLEGVTVGPLLEAHLVRFEEARLRAYELRMEAGLQLGRHHELIAELKALTTEHPLHEGFPAQLMLALYRSGRRLEALEVYRSLRQRLVSELGVEPSGELARLHRAVLGGDQSLNLPGGKRARIQVQGSPAQLPAAKPGFTGRRDASAQLEALLCASGGAGRRGDAKPRLASLHGMPGVGKSALAIHTAQRLRSHFPDGQLYVDLREAGGRPGSPAEAVAGFLRAAGTRPPQRLEARCELFRQWSAHRRLLVVLDNVESAEQVLPLLPAGPECATILTSRSHLAGLGEVAALELALPSTDEAVQLLASLVGQERTEREPAQAERIVRLCGALPAALRAAAYRINAGHGTLRETAERLSDEGGRLDALTSPDVDLRESFALSYRRLGQNGRRMFDRLGSLPDGGFTRADLAAGDVDVDEALEQLVDSKLVERVFRIGADDSYEPVYRCHELVRLYMQERFFRTRARLGAGPIAGVAALAGACAFGRDAIAQPGMPAHR
ncbi:AfsR/SARP family transcriptional regulator [Streptomyces olivoverticillatus]|uniref:AfsR/SARP family transcriptional regulator n=1 Tax=Streptomyces olivoverticillatus TaxID=66427 RepID=UPI001621576C|nr:AfsR/SARP family transcriptional regulator [Streptomyces olivoverticillatus]